MNDRLLRTSELKQLYFRCSVKRKKNRVDFINGVPACKIQISLSFFFLNLNGYVEYKYNSYKQYYENIF